MKAVLVPESGTPRVVDVNGLDDLQKQVGGWIEVVWDDHDCATAYGNEEAKMINRKIELEDGSEEWVEGLAENELATAIIVGDKAQARRRKAAAMAAYEQAGVAVIQADTGDPREPFIAGPVLFCGINRETGENTDVPEDVERMVRAAAELHAKQTTGRELPEPVEKRKDRTIDYEWDVALDPETGKRTLAVLSVGHHRAGVNFLSGSRHPNEFSAILQNETVEDRNGFVARGFTLGSGVRLMSQEVTRYSEKRRDEFAALALDRLRSLARDGDRRVLRYFAVPDGS